MNNKRGLLVRMLLSIGLPVAIIFAIVAGIALYVVNQSIAEIKVNELSARSESVSNQIETYFTKYLEDASQLSTNPEIQSLFNQVTPGVGITATANFPEIKQQLDNVAASDPDNIQVAWIADVDSSQFTQSDGVVSDPSYDINVRPWFKELVAKKKVFISEPYVDITTQKIIVSVVAPVFKPGTQELVGATCVDVSIDRIKEIIAENKIGEAGFFVVSTSSGMVFDHPNPDYNNGLLTDTDMSENIIAALMEKTTGPITYSTGGSESQGYVTEIGNIGWVLATGLPTTEFNGTFSGIRTMMLLVFGLGLLVIIRIIVSSTGNFVRPIIRLAEAADRLALGDVDIDQTMAADAKDDEIGELTRSFVNMARKYQGTG